MQSHELKFLTSVYKQRFDILKDAISKPISNMIPNMLAYLYNHHVYVVIWANTITFNLDYTKTWLKKMLKITLIRLFDLCVIYIDHLKRFIVLPLQSGAIKKSLPTYQATTQKIFGDITGFRKQDIFFFWPYLETCIKNAYRLLHQSKFTRTEKKTKDKFFFKQ